MSCPVAVQYRSAACGESRHLRSGGEEKDARSRKFINVLAEDAGTVAAWLVPRMRGVRGNGKYFKCASSVTEHDCAGSLPGLCVPPV